MRADGRTVTRENLQGDGSGNALEVCISRLRPRVEAAGLLIRTIRGFGYRLERSKEHATVQTSLRRKLLSNLAAPTGLLLAIAGAVASARPRGMVGDA